MRYRTIIRSGWIAVFFILLGALAFAVMQGLDQPARINWGHDFGAAIAQAKSEKKPLLLDFWADWCEWCVEMERTTYTDPAVAELAKKFVCVKVNADDHPELTRRYHVESMPTVIVQGPDGEKPTSIRGFVPSGEFRRALEGILKDLGSK